MSVRNAVESAFGLSWKPRSLSRGIRIAASTIESDVHIFYVQEDGSVTEDDETTLRANTAAGIEDIAQRYVWFDRNISRVDILEAYTLDRSGATHTVTPDQIREVQEPRSAGAPTFQDARLKAVIFPAIEAGARIHLKFHKTQSVPLVPGQFSYFVEPDRGPVESQRLIYDLPAHKKLYADARGYVALAPVTHDGRTRYEFDYSKEHYDRVETGSVGYVTYGDRLMVSTFPDFATFAASYRDAAVDPTANSPAIRDLAMALTRNDADPRAKARTLYDWVRQNIRYVSLFLGQSPAAPHRAIDILANRYGDCKDHVALYGALLAAVGIRSEVALISLGSVHTLPSVPGYGGSAINHTITWLPDLNMYADTTTPNIEFGFLPLADMDRPTLLVDEGVLARTPATEALARTSRLQIEVAVNGTATFAYWVEDSGWSAETERTSMRLATWRRREQIAADRLRLTNLRGIASLTTSDVDATAGPFSTTFRGTLDRVVWPTGTTAVPALTSLTGGIATQVRNWLAERTRTQPYLCPAGQFDETAQIKLPYNVRVLDMPDDLATQDQFLDFSSRYVFDPTTKIIQVTRRLTVRFAGQVCSPADYAASRSTLERIDRDVQSQVIVRSN
ncbi:DUF3857 domain-containing transglutaminase family protein [Burkholderia diffusa]|uniref:DUF3857 domain-containing transglutaminase family protein n=1 Tax=Burkholderia diffusa TaxID=488732 RepID=UPI00158AA0A2|nr:DUF3857 and transglutaminase domain-containing protein [Burkholderia diffusa]